MDVEGLIERKTRKGVAYYENDSGDVVAKFCKKCSTIRSRSDYSPDYRRTPSLRSSCKYCESRYREENAERIADYHREWVILNAEYETERKRKYRQENAEKVAEYMRNYYLANSKVISERLKDYRKDNSEKLAEYLRDWQDKNPGKRLALRHRRRANKSGLPNDLTDTQFLEMREFFNGGCALTGVSEGIHIDHVIPISTGHGGTTVGNVVPLVGQLNFSKGSKNVFDWFDSNRERFGIDQNNFDRMVEYLAQHNAMTPAEYREYVDSCYANRND